MNNDAQIPSFLLDAFPVLLEASLIKKLASPVPIVPDTIFELFKNTSDSYFALVTTDYPDPIYQSAELEDISRVYTFRNLIIPHSSHVIDISQVNNADECFFVNEKDTHWRYYVVQLTVTT